jgi:sugar fermentation stimulation protein A
MVHTSKPLRFDPPLVRGTLLKRYKRFFADIELPDGSVVIAHCANTGSMTGLLEEGSTVWIQYHGTVKRKLAWSWELASQDDVLVGVNTSLPNRLVHQAINEGFIAALRGYKNSRREVTFGHSRLDIHLTSHETDARECFVEVKNVTLAKGQHALFPDAVTARGLKHLHTLIDAVREGHRAVQFFLIQRPDCQSFGPAWSVDPVYSKALSEASAQGVEVMAWQVQMQPEALALVNALPVHLNEDL